MKAMGYEPTPLGVARFYEGVIEEFFLDSSDKTLAKEVSEFSQPKFSNLIMTDLQSKIHLVQEILGKSNH